MTERALMDRFRQALRTRTAALPVADLRNHSLNRRTFFLGTTATGLAFTNSASGRQDATPAASPVADSAGAENLFSLGVASGDPQPHSVVLWTRLAPMPFERDGGMGSNPVEVRWEVATDEQMSNTLQTGMVIAESAWAHSVHVEVDGLEPGAWYWYRFRVGDVESPIGRTRTAPAAGSTVDRFRFAFASCQRWDHGLYTAYRDMAAQDVDLVVHLGDYIYEYPISGRDFLREGEFPFSALLETTTLDDYRGRYALHKLDPDLREAHRLAPWIVTWDDHEVSNNIFGALIRDEPAAQTLLERRADAYQAYYEHQPLRDSSRPKGPDLQLYRRLTFGGLLEFNVLDTRQYRSPQGIACDDESRAALDGFCPDSLDPDRTMLGDAQLRWLIDGVDQASARWNILAQQVPFARIDHDPMPNSASYGGSQMDKWDGYAIEREHIANAIAGASRARSFNPVVITGDVHANFVWDLKTDWDASGNDTLFGTEFVGTSISSVGDEPLEDDGGFTTQCGNLDGNEHNHLFDNHRGYVLCDVTPTLWQTDYRVMSNVTKQDATASTLASFVLEDGRPGAQQAAECKRGA